MQLNSLVCMAIGLGRSAIASSTRGPTINHDSSVMDWLAASFAKEEFFIGSIPYGLVTMHHALQGKRMHVQLSSFNAI